MIINIYIKLAWEWKTKSAREKGVELATFEENVHDPNASALHRIKWHRIVLDEAHTIKEPSTQQAKAIYALIAESRWCITGTPLV